MWAGWLVNNTLVIVFFNQADADSTIAISLSQELGIAQISSYSTRDPIRHTNLGVSTRDVLTAKVSSHSVEVRVLSVFFKTTEDNSILTGISEV